MKMTKRKVFVAALAICLIAILSMGTLAWFSDSDSVKNDFMIAQSDDDTADEVFSIDVWEAQEDGDREQTGYEYDDVVPGDNLPKIVHVENTGYYDQYVRVTVTVSDADAWQAMLGEDVTLGEIVEGFDESKVYASNRTEVDDTLVYVLYYKDILKGDNDASAAHDFVVFESVKIPTSMTAAQAAAFNDGTDPSFYINVAATAIQTENVGEDILEAFETVEGTAPVIDTVYVSSFEEIQAAADKYDDITIKLVSDVEGGGLVIG